MEYKRKCNTTKGKWKNEPSINVHFDLLSVKQAAGILNIGTQAVRAAIANGRLKAQYINGKVRLLPQDVKEYEKTKWQRNHRYDEDELSIKNAAKILNVPEQRLYYLMRTDDLKFYYKQKKMIAIKKKDLLKTFGR